MSRTTYALWIHNIRDQYWEFLNIVIYSSRYSSIEVNSFFVSLLLCKVVLAFPGGSNSKKSGCNAEDLGLVPGLGRSPRAGMATHSSTLAWRIPWAEEPGRLQSFRLQRVGHDWATNTRLFYNQIQLTYSSLCLRVNLNLHFLLPRMINIFFSMSL